MTSQRSDKPRNKKRKKKKNYGQTSLEKCASNPASEKSNSDKTNSKEKRIRKLLFEINEREVQSSTCKSGRKKGKKGKREVQGRGHQITGGEGTRDGGSSSHGESLTLFDGKNYNMMQPDNEITCDGERGNGWIDHFFIGSLPYQYRFVAGNSKMTKRVV